MKNFTRSPKTIFVPNFARKWKGDRLLPDFPQVFHRRLLATTQVQQEIV
ncbi:MULTISPECIES: hypothetical protein [unclassified Microcoleus]